MIPILPLALAATLEQAQLRCEGQGPYTVILEESVNAPIDFQRLRNELRHELRVCAHRSDAGSLVSSVPAAGERPPFVLVSAKGASALHSAFQAARPADVAGVVLLDYHRSKYELADTVFDAVEAHRSGRRIAMTIDEMKWAGDPCVIFSATRLPAGRPFVQRLPQDLELRLDPRDGDLAWISFTGKACVPR